MKIIINLNNKCKTLSEISKIVYKPRCMIRGIIDKYRYRKTLKNNPRNGRKRKINEYTG